MSGRAFVSVLVAGLTASACGFVLSIDPYRACQGAECDGADAASLVCGADEAGTICPLGMPACSAGRCVAVDKLARGMSAFQCALLKDQTVQCWGNNDFGQLGQGTTGSPGTPAPVIDAKGKPLGKIVDVSQGLREVCALDDAGQVFCWGEGPPGGKNFAQQVSLFGVQAISLSSADACALMQGGDVKCWGSNPYGEIGCDPSDAGTQGVGCATKTAVPPTPGAGAPRPLASAKGVIHLAAGLYATCTHSGANSPDFQCWGNEIWGNLGDGKVRGDPDWCCGTPAATTSVGGGAAITALQATDFYACAQDFGNQWWCWGMGNYEGCTLLGNCGVVSTPKRIIVSPDVSWGWKHACATDYTNVTCWGLNKAGQAGDGTTSPNADKPATVLGLTGRIRSLAAHRNFTCALQDDGQVKCWGEDGSGTMLGFGDAVGAVLTAMPVKWQQPPVSPDASPDD